MGGKFSSGKKWSKNLTDNNTETEKRPEGKLGRLRGIETRILEKKKRKKSTVMHRNKNNRTQKKK